eukprot:131852-Rhodomonas_salina.1
MGGVTVEQVSVIEHRGPGRQLEKEGNFTGGSCQKSIYSNSFGPPLRSRPTTRGTQTLDGAVSIGSTALASAW